MKLFNKEIKKKKFILPQKINFEKDIKKLLEKHGFNTEQMIIQEVIIKAEVNKFPFVSIKYIPLSYLERR